MNIIIVDILLAFIIFFIQNVLGRRAFNLGYVRFSLLEENDENYSTNFVIKVFGPIVYLIIVVGILQYYKLNAYTTDIINVIHYYVLLRVVLIFLYQRVEIINWLLTLFQYFTLVTLANIFYTNFISKVSDILPDLTQMKNELWLAVLVFLYQVFNKQTKEKPDSENKIQPEVRKRKKRYILKKYSKFTELYDVSLETVITDKQLKLVAYAIIIIENFNRPFLIRALERLYVKVFGKVTTIGIMQVASVKNLTDKQSIIEGGRILQKDYDKFKEKDYNIYRNAIRNKNRDINYIREILFVLMVIIDNCYEDERLDAYSDLTDTINSEFFIPH